jgi:Big-like domain-containing protein
METRRRLHGCALVIWTALVLASMAGTALAATPSSGTVTESNPTVTWTGMVMPPTAGGCGGPNNSACDNFRLSIIPPSAAFGPYSIRITLTPTAGDWDLEVYGPTGGLVASSGNSPQQTELVTLSNPPAGTYTVTGVPFAPAGGYSAQAELQHQSIVIPPPGTEPVTYFNHVTTLQSPGSDEPSIGCNWNSDKVMFTGSLRTSRISFDDCTSPATAAWQDVSFATTSTVSLDPILFTDHITGRTFVSQLTGQDSLTAFTDNDGTNWTPSQGGGIPSGVDHQTIGGGPFHAPIPTPPPPLYPNAVYYCSQDIATAFCARSDNGGVTFGAGVPIYDLTECGGLHGHVKVDFSNTPSRGTVYVPNKGCNGLQAAVVSENNGITWDVRSIAGSVAGDTDPSVGIASDGTVYFGWADGTGRPMIAVSHDRGLSWSNVRDVGASVMVGSQVGIKHTVFPAVVAGDPMRAAFAFHGSTEPTPGGTGDDANWPGDWYLYVAHTYDGGLTWTTVNAAPNDPVQRGTICTAGINCDFTRNLLDFFGAAVDRQGRVLVGYADGCVGDCVTRRPNSFTARSTIARQTNGRRLLAQFDVTGPPASPLVTGTFDTCAGLASVVHLSWSTPDDHGFAITGYKIYRRTASTAFALLASVGAGVNSYDDSTFNPNQSPIYRVTAVNAAGEGQACSEIQPGCPGGTTTESACVAPGLTILTDALGDASTGRPEHDVVKLSISEPGSLGPGKILFTLKMAGLSSPPPNTTWPILLRANGTTDYAVRMHTDPTGQVFFTVATGANNTNPVLNAGTPADPSSGFSADGTIRIVVSRSALGNLAPGQVLDMFLVRIRVEGGAVAVTPDNMPDSLARTGIYTAVGSENCTGQAPTARDDAASTVENTPVVINVLANDSDGGAPPLAVTNVGPPANGTTTNNGDGTVTYRPNMSFTGSDSFTYTIKNGQNLSATATVRVRVNPFCPLVPTGSFSDTFEPGAKPGWGVDTFKNNLGPASPTWQVMLDPIAHSATHSFFSDASTLDLKDDRLVAPTQNISSTSHLIFWHRFNFENTFDGGVLEVSTDDGGTWTDVLAGGGSFVSGGYNGTVSAGFGSPIAGRAAWTGGPINAAAAPMTKVDVNLGAFAGLGEGLRVRWRLATDPLAVGSTPGQGWWIDDVQFTNTLVTSVCNRPPIANDDTAGTTQNTPVTISVLANDTDPDGDALTVQSVTQPAHGTATTNGTTATYTPNTNFTGTDTFTYTVRDTAGNTATAKVTVTVSATPNRPPVAANDAASTTKNTAVTIDVLANDTDPDGDQLSVQSVTDPPHGTATNNGNSVTYTPDSNFVGTDTFNYTVSDGRGGTSSAMVTVNVTQPVNRPPTANPDSATTQQNTPVTINVVANDTDPDGDTLTVTGVTQGAHGTVTNNNNGTVTYSPSAGFTGTDTFTYTISDGHGGTATGQVTVTVQPPTTGKVTGGGWVPAKTGNGKANFGFNAQQQTGVKGRITFDDNSKGIGLKGVVNSLRITGSQADFSGTCSLSDGTQCNYSAHVEDRAEPGAGKDRFKIQIFNLSGAQLYATDQLLGGGNIQVH